MTSRPYFRRTVGELEKQYENAKGDATELTKLAHELKFRQTSKAKTIARMVEQSISKLTDPNERNSSRATSSSSAQEEKSRSTEVACQGCGQNLRIPIVPGISELRCPKCHIGFRARCLLVDSLKFMCHECLFNRQEGQPPGDRLPVSTRKVAEGREYPGGCGSYMPFAVSAAAIAAALTLDLARDWARGNLHPRLRLRRLDLKHTQGRDDSSPKPLDTCPACRRK